MLYNIVLASAMHQHETATGIHTSLPLDQLLEFTQIHVHWVGDAIQPSHPLLSPSPAFNLSQHQGLFKWVSSLHQVAKVLEFQLQHRWVIESVLRRNVHSQHWAGVSNSIPENSGELPWKQITRDPAPFFPAREVLCFTWSLLRRLRIPPRVPLSWYLFSHCFLHPSTSQAGHILQLKVPYAASETRHSQINKY